jgi:hypothetical protein
VKTFLHLAALFSAATFAPAADAPGPAFFEALRAADRKLATIADRLVTANVALCDQRAPALGLVLHGINQYGRESWPAAKHVFKFVSPVSVEATIPGAAVARASVADDDGVVAIGGQAMPATPEGSTPGSGDRDRALALIDALAPDRPVELTLLRGDRRFDVTLPARPGCRSHFEIVIGRGYDAQADGLHVQLGEKFFEGFSDQEIAVVVAHELAHNILRHRERLDAAKVGRGIAAEIGRNARLFRETEDQADALSVYLLANAGYDPLAPGRFWRAYAGRVGGEGLFRSRTHASGQARASAMDAIAASIAREKARPITPDLLAERDKPLR